MRMCLMVEGQEDITWDEWRALASACEEAGLEALFRSDHYLSVMGRVGRGSLDAWATLAALAALTERIRLGTMVSPATFRHPSVLAKSVVTVDHVSGGRAELGLGAGWHEDEHHAYGFPFPPTGTRMEILAEQLEIVARSWDDGSFDFDGAHYRVEDLDALPKPVRRPRPNLIVGGAGNRRSAELAARWADEYNTVHCGPQECARRKRTIDDACERAERGPLTFSLMTGAIVGVDERDVRRRAENVMTVMGDGGSTDDFLDNVRDDWVVGTVGQAAERLAELADAGVERVMLQHIAHRDVDMVHLLGEEVAAALR